jgi:fatty acid kinase fatty acid binding subunit
MSVAICTDSSSLLSASEAASLGVDIVPVAVTLAGEPFDELTSSVDWFYERLRAGAVATTSQPSPGELAAAYERAVERGADSIVSVHVDARASGTVASAELAAREASLFVQVVDTRTVSYGVGLSVRAAAEALAAGGTAGDAARAASRKGGAVRNAFVVRESPGGRVPSSGAWTVGRFEGAAAARIAQCPSIPEAIAALGREALAGEGPIAAAVGHAGRELEAAADDLARRLAEVDGVLEVERYRVGAAVGAHTGPDSFGLFWWPASQ